MYFTSTYTKQYEDLLQIQYNYTMDMKTSVYIVFINMMFFAQKLLKHLVKFK